MGRNGSPCFRLACAAPLTAALDWQSLGVKFFARAERHCRYDGRPQRAFWMRADNHVTVRQADFTAAAAAVFRGRSPRGSRRIGPRDTLIYVEAGHLIIETPIVRTPLSMDGSWTVCISVSANALALVSGNLRPTASISRAFVAGSLILESGLFTLPAIVTTRRIPTAPTSRP